jgi:hypothetical protein
LTICPDWLTLPEMNPASLANLRPPWTPEEVKKASADGNAKLSRMRAEKASGVNPRIARLQIQLSRIEAMMNKATEARDLAALAAAHERLFKSWQVLTGTPNPGSRRSKPIRPQAPSAAPVEAQIPQDKPN